MLALGVPSSSLRRMVPAVAVYLISLPSILRECLVTTFFSSGTGGFFSSFGFSAGFSSAFPGCVCDCGCWARQVLAAKSSAAKPKQQSECFIGTKSPQTSHDKCITATCGIVSESRDNVNWRNRCVMDRMPLTKNSPRSVSCGESCCQLSLCLY